MEYRIHPKTGDRISVIGIGTGPIFEAPEKEAVAALAYAHEQGINYADFATAGAETFRYAGMAFASVRKEMFYQVHFGANYETGEYGWTTSLDKVKRQVDWQLKELKTDYIDFGFIHCLDSEDDWKRAYDELNEFERELTDAGTVVLKFWVHIDKQAQLERFQDRQRDPAKQWKITEEDWRNREKWDAYQKAVDEMLQKTSTQNAPWHILESVDKRYARIKAMKLVIHAIEQAL